MEMVYRIRTMLTSLCLCLVAASQVSGARAVIRPVGYSPQQARDLGLEIHRATPLRVIGVGQPVYLESIHEGTYSWSLTVPEGSSTTLSSTNTREVYLVPDQTGPYSVSLDFIDSKGSSSTDTDTITAAVYVGVGTVSGDSATEFQCAYCHEEKAASWELTGHASLMQRGLDGTASLYYEESCIACHSTGYDTLAVNDGFDDRAAQEGWVFPDSLYEGVFDTLVAGYPRTAQMAHIQCESCHGPGSEHQGSSGPIGLSYSTGVCAYCHDEQEAEGCGCSTYETYFYTEQWRNSRHGNKYSTEEDFNVEGGSCVPCHTAEGFFEVNVREDHQATAPYNNLHGITCAVCHDPHDASGEHQLRTAGDYLSASLSGTSGYKTEGTSATACDICHHLRPDTDVPGTLPHLSHQTDVMKNRAGYRYPGEFYPGGNIHDLVIKGRCTGCHMAPTYGDRLKYIGSHTFATFAAANPDSGGPAEDLYLTEACIGCHGSIGDDFDFKNIQTRVTRLLDQIEAKLVLYAEDAPAGMQGKPRYSREDMEAGIITEAQMNAAYNWYIFTNDGSKGVHNPFLTRGILEDALSDLGGPELVCDQNADGSINILDVISLLLFQRDNKGDLDGDFNFDGTADISDAVSMLVAQFSGTCSDASIQLASAGTSQNVKFEGLSSEDIEYLERMISTMELTAEERAAFGEALYGSTGQASLPKAFALKQNSPNPFNPSTTIAYAVQEGSPVQVRLEVFDIRGRSVRVLVDDLKQAGTYNVFWDGTDETGKKIASGVYFYRMRAGEFLQIRKMVLLK
jgi:flagellar hook capping protein FlgD/cytochrome c554/c'-like protein